MNTKVKNREKSILKAASLYYIDGLNQDDIAKRLRTSRPTVVRMLQQARDSGLVEIRLTKQLPHAMLMEKSIQEKLFQYGVKDVLVVDESDLSPKEVVARAAANYLQSILRKDHILGIGWSTTLLHLPRFFDVPKYSPSHVVQLAGSAGSQFGANSHEIAIGISDKLNVPVEHIPSPVLLPNKSARDSMLHDPVIKKTFSWAKKCNLAIISVGVATEDSTLADSGYLKKSDVRKLARQGSVGDILAQYYDIKGNEVKASWCERRLSVDLQQIRKIDNVIVVAAGRVKCLPIIGAVKGGYINTLIIDVPLAKSIINHIESQ